MVVEVTNITDGPGRTPTQVDIYNKTLDPGSSIQLPAELVNPKVRNLEIAGLICIGPLPPWYASAKMRKGRSLTDEEMQRRIGRPKKAATPAPKQETKVEAKTETKTRDESNEGSDRKKG